MKVHLTYLTIILLLLCLMLPVSNKKEKNQVGIIKYHTDTTFVVRHDTVTIVEKDIILTEHHIIDTVYLISNKIEIEEYHFSKEGLYDIHATGYMVNINDISIFPKTEYKIVTNTIENKIADERWKCYMGAGVSFLENNKISPNIVLTVKAPQKWLFGLNLGIYNGNPVIGCNIGYEL